MRSSVIGVLSAGLLATGLAGIASVTSGAARAVAPPATAAGSERAAKKPTLTVTIIGLPTGAKARVVVIGPKKFHRSLAKSAVIRNAKPGIYTVTAKAVTVRGEQVRATRAKLRVAISKKESKAVTVRYKAGNAPPRVPPCTGSRPQLAPANAQDTVLAPRADPGGVLDAGNCQSVLASMAGYNAQSKVPMGFTGNIERCQAGTTSLQFRHAVTDRVNWFRAMVGLPGVGLSEDLSASAQEAALMMAAQGDLSHYPGAGWACYSGSGAESAGRSNLYLGLSGPSAITGYIDDPGDSNTAAGHRWWILTPKLTSIGTGDTPGSNALTVITDFGGKSPEFSAVAWPPPGYVPNEVVPNESDRWSFRASEQGEVSCPAPAWSPTCGPNTQWSLDLTEAAVTMSGPSGSVTTEISDRSNDQLVWQVPDAVGYAKQERSYVVHVVNVRRAVWVFPQNCSQNCASTQYFDPQTRSYSYVVTVIGE